MTERPFAIHITWTTYGTWLPGDPRGYVSNTRKPDGTFERKHNTPGTPCDAADAETYENARRAQAHETVWLTREQAAVVARNLARAATDKDRGWHILRAAVMANHAHVVVTGCPNDGPAVRRVLKGVTQAALSRHHGSPRRWWTEGGSDRYKHGDRAVEAAVEYDAHQHGILAGVDAMRVFVVEDDGTLRYLDANE
ncbi:hypothetical protein : Marine sediment metagenome DNA, contig: S01H4_S10653 (Fragment) OS=marine sediment metagenome GN=S01H4_46183 PE=4 SV=1 [Gemmataceae bacterium]|jgi:REP element-mobilizing transposase RayT